MQIGGTPAYLSPEQACGQTDRIGRATDVFGLGAILFFLLTKAPLYSGENGWAALAQCPGDRLRSQAPGSPRYPASVASNLPESAGHGTEGSLRHSG